METVWKGKKGKRPRWCLFLIIYAFVILRIELTVYAVNYNIANFTSIPSWNRALTMSKCIK